MIRLALALSIIAAPAMAQDSWTSSRVGPFTYYNGSNGWTGSSSQVGPFNYSHFNGPNGQSTQCTSSRVGNQVYTNCQ